MFTTPIVLGLYLECRFLKDNHEEFYFFVGAFTAPFISVLYMVLEKITGEVRIPKEE